MSTMPSVSLLSRQPLQLPLPLVAVPQSAGVPVTRVELIEKKKVLRAKREQASGEFRKQTTTPEKNLAAKAVSDCLAEEALLEERLAGCYLPQHGAQQLINPRALFISPLFRVRPVSVPREKLMEFRIDNPDGKGSIEYCGPELRQSDALVFMGLLNMLRDVQVGTTVTFHPHEACEALFGRYDGPARNRLRETIYRLQRALLKFDTFAVQLVQLFKYPSRGPWSVALDAAIVEVFKATRTVWLDLPQRLQLPEGLATWLYGYIESQAYLIPTKVADLQARCGSEAEEAVFTKKLKSALKALVEKQILDEGWTLKQGVLRWKKL